MVGTVDKKRRMCPTGHIPRIYISLLSDSERVIDHNHRSA